MAAKRKPDYVIAREQRTQAYLRQSRASRARAMRRTAGETEMQRSLYGDALARIDVPASADEIAQAQAVIAEVPRGPQASLALRGAK